MTENMYYGADCPDDMVQVECVMTDAELRPNHDVLPGWKPGRSATIEIYVGGRRFIILVGDAAKAYGHDAPGIVVQNPYGLTAKPVAINSVLVTFDETGERIWRSHRNESATSVPAVDPQGGTTHV